MDTANRWTFIALSARCHTVTPLHTTHRILLILFSIAITLVFLPIAVALDVGAATGHRRANDRPMRRRNKTSIRMIKVCRNTASWQKTNSNSRVMIMTMVILINTWRAVVCLPKNTPCVPLAYFYALHVCVCVLFFVIFAVVVVMLFPHIRCDCAVCLPCPCTVLSYLLRATQQRSSHFHSFRCRLFAIVVCVCVRRSTIFHNFILLLDSVHFYSPVVSAYCSLLSAVCVCV